MYLEAAVDRGVVEYARRKGVLVIKLSLHGAHGTAGWPDRMFLYKGKTLFMEMKGSNGKATGLQLMRIDALKAQGFHAYVINDPDLGKRLIDDFVSMADTCAIIPTTTRSTP
jgi:hypothetical protein